MNRQDFLKTMSLGVASLAAGRAIPGQAAGNRPPNIVLIMADDISQEVLGCYGGDTYKTPNLDRLAATGMRFNHCYSSPVCAPSRVKLLTGRYGFRNYRRWGHIPPGEITFGHVLRDAGYATALSGKWQLLLQKTDPKHITKMGFERNCVFGWHEGPRYHGPLIYENGELRREPDDRYGPDIFCEFITDFIKRNTSRPFLAYFSMALAHAISNDLDTPPPVGPNGRYQTYKELVEYMDTLVGRIVISLDELDLRENTLILFTGDNGTPKRFITKTKNGKYIQEPIVSKFKGERFIGGKRQLTDAGTRVPLIANWPGTTPAGEVLDDLVDFSDFMPTLAELSGASLPEGVTIDGRSFAPQLRGRKGTPREWVYCQWGGKAWIRDQRWKLYRNGKMLDIPNDRLEKAPILKAADTRETAAVRRIFKGVFDSLK